MNAVLPKKFKKKGLDRGFHTVDPTTLVPSPYNPINRADKGNITDLIKSIGEHGQFMPILVDSELNIIDGHRRHAALVELSEPICFVRVIDSDPAKAYAEVNSASKKLSGNDHLNVYLKNPGAMTESSRRGMEKMATILGPDNMAFIADRGGSIATFKQAMQVCKYCGVEGQSSWIQAVTRWLIGTRQTYLVRKALEEGISPSTLLACVEQNKPLKRSWGAA